MSANFMATLYANQSVLTYLFILKLNEIATQKGRQGRQGQTFNVINSIQTGKQSFGALHKLYLQE